MSPVRPDAPLRKVTLNLYEADCQDLERSYGHGWSTQVRDQIHIFCQQSRAYNAQFGAPTPRRTLGDLADD